MPRRRLIWKLYPIGVIAILLSIAAVGWYADVAVREFHLAQVDRDLEARTNLIRMRVAPLFNSDRAGIDALAKELATAGAVRVTVITGEGLVLADSDHELPLENHANRPEIVAAMAGHVGLDTRPSRTLGVPMRYLAEPIRDGDRVVGVVRTALAIEAIDQQLYAVYRRMTLGAIVIAAIASGVGLVLFVRLIGKPLEEIKQSAVRFAGGELAHHVEVHESEEFGGLAESLNRMAAQLDEKIRTITRQSHEQQAVLSSMIEGVVAVDTRERIISLNDAANSLLGLNPATALGRRISEVVRNTQLQRLVTTTLSSSDPVEGDIVLSHPGEDGHGVSRDRQLQARGTILRDAGGHGIGALVVLNDVTHLRRLENMRRDFVANVSHELKTPITSIKGFIETLRDGAIDDREKAMEFLTIIGRQAERLNSIIEDLLRLSRIEQDAERSQIELSPHRLAEVLKSAVGDCESLASQRGITTRVVCPPELTVRINAALLEQAVVNLVDNAIKYSEAGTEVSVEAGATGEEFFVRVRDNGCGIPAEHLPRIFERFYRVDKARSRRQGGTGLGLAIVKHIAQAHRGTASVESTVGQGSTFTLRLPMSVAREPAAV